MTGHFVLIEYPDAPSVLDLNPRDKADCARAIRWQREGGNDPPMHICRYDVATDSFVSIADEARQFQPDRKPYTAQAWQRFKARLRFHVMSRDERLKAVWRFKHPDYRGIFEGSRQVLIYRNGTVSVPLESLSDDEIRQAIF